MYSLRLIPVKYTISDIKMYSGQDPPCPKKRSRYKAEIESKPKHIKTEIEYSIDSEVSSDGEEIYFARSN